MTLHNESHPLAGQTVKVIFKGEGHPQINASKNTPFEYTIEDYWDRLTGRSWGMSDGNPAAIVYGLRAGMNQLPWDDEVVYGKIGGLGHLVHVSEIINPDTEELTLTSGVDAKA